MSKNQIKTVDDLFATRSVATAIMSLDELAKLVTEKGFTTKAQCIRYLAAEGHSRASIAKTLNVRYQQVRNTLEDHKNKNV